MPVCLRSWRDGLEDLRSRIDVRVAAWPFASVAARAWDLSWTRDPFDRLIAAMAMAEDVPLYTADGTILAHCPVARWA